MYVPTQMRGIALAELNVLDRCWQRWCKKEDWIQQRAADNYQDIARLRLDTIYFLSYW